MSKHLEKLVRVLEEKGYHVSTAESCTGGLVAGSIVSVAGAAEVFEEGYVTYSNRVKEKVLGVDGETLACYTAVSEPVARQMAVGACANAGTEVSVSVTGYAGPDDAEDGTPAGTVYIGVCLLGKTSVKKYCFDGDRNEVRRKAAQKAILDLLECLQ